MTDYTITETFVDYGFEYELNEPAIEQTEWEVTSITATTITITHETGTRIELNQDGTIGSDLPFSAERITPNDNRYKLTESDWPSETVEVATAFMMGYHDALDLSN